MTEDLQALYNARDQGLGDDENDLMQFKTPLEDQKTAIATEDGVLKEMQKVLRQKEAKLA